jgi:DNA-binding SARP family transcriptional activator
VGRRWNDLLQLEPADEQAHLELMRAHAARGDRRGGLRRFERLDRALRVELGVAPGREGGGAPRPADPLGHLPAG